MLFFVRIAVIMVLLVLAAGCGSEKLDRQMATENGKSQNQAGAMSAQAEMQRVVPAGVPILMYHSVGNEKNNDAVIAPELFREQMAFLKRENYQPITMDELYEYLVHRRPLPPKPVVLTFDDGYRDTYEVVYPVLKQYGFKSTLFVIVGEIGRSLTPAELREMQAAGMAIMPHGYSHRDLGELPAPEQVAEIGKAKAELDRILGQDSRHFCYPNGSYNQETLRILREMGFKTAVTINPGWIKSGDDPLVLNRVWIGNGVDLERFRERLTRADYTILP